MHVVVRVRRVLAIHPWIHWTLCVALAVGAGAVTHRYLGRVEEERRSWGTTQEVWTATTDLDPGDTVGAEPTDVPVALVPPDALTSPPGGAVARQRVTAGEILVDADVAPASGPAALAESGTVVVGVVDPLARGLTIGLPVQVAAEGVVLAPDATVVGLSDDVIQLAVPERDAPIVAAAAHDGRASILLVP